eukprot:GHVQ01006525.1.p1 GENE.GHVQ01006525.1~~GHVQ01006525.1.p1  ORF type:complete len:1027 (+),score=142.00 GHVQ01006525.1:106-3081(+)
MAPHVATVAILLLTFAWSAASVRLTPLPQWSITSNGIVTNTTNSNVYLSKQVINTSQLIPGLHVRKLYEVPVSVYEEVSTDSDNILPNDYQYLINVPTVLSRTTRPQFLQLLSGCNVLSVRYIPHNTYLVSTSANCTTLQFGSLSHNNLLVSILPYNQTDKVSDSALSVCAALSTENRTSSTSLVGTVDINVDSSHRRLASISNITQLSSILLRTFEHSVLNAIDVASTNEAVKHNTDESITINQSESDSSSSSISFHMNASSLTTTDDDDDDHIAEQHHIRLTEVRLAKLYRLTLQNISPFSCHYLLQQLASLSFVISLQSVSNFRLSDNYANRVVQGDFDAPQNFAGAGAKTSNITQDEPTSVSGATTSSDRDNVSNILWRNGLLGQGQVIGVGDSGARSDSCFFEDKSIDIPINTLNYSHRKIVGYFSHLGDTIDIEYGHGTHVASLIAGNPQGVEDPRSSSGIAPEAKLLFVDLVYINDHGEPVLNVPADIPKHYLDIFRKRNVTVVSSSWGSFGREFIYADTEVDEYLAEHQDVLAVFAAGNDGAAFNVHVDSPAKAKNVLTVGATWNYREAYKLFPQIELMEARFYLSSPCSLTPCESLKDSMYITASPAAFGPLAQLSPDMIGLVTGGKLNLTEPQDGCDAMLYTEPGSIAVTMRGGCFFTTKAQHAQDAGYVGLLLVNNKLDESPYDVAMVAESYESAAAITIPVVLISFENWHVISEASKAAALEGSDVLIDFPLQASYAQHKNVAPFSSYGSPDGRVKPEVVAPGHMLLAADAADVCGVRTHSGTSQATPMIAGAAGILKQYFITGRYPSGVPEKSNRVSGVLASTLKAIFVASAHLTDFSESSNPSTTVDKTRSTTLTSAGTPSLSGGLRDPYYTEKGGFGYVSLADSLKIVGTQSSEYQHNINSYIVQSVLYESLTFHPYVFQIEQRNSSDIDETLLGQSSSVQRMRGQSLLRPYAPGNSTEQHQRRVEAHAVNSSHGR